MKITIGTFLGTSCQGGQTCQFIPEMNPFPEAQMLEKFFRAFLRKADPLAEKLSFDYVKNLENSKDWDVRGLFSEDVEQRRDFEKFQFLIYIVKILRKELNYKKLKSIEPIIMGSLGDFQRSEISRLVALIENNHFLCLRHRYGSHTITVLKSAGLR